MHLFLHILHNYINIEIFSNIMTGGLSIFAITYSFILIVYAARFLNVGKSPPQLCQYFTRCNGSHWWRSISRGIQGN